MQTKPFCCSKPSGWSINTSSWRHKFKNTLLTSNYLTCHPRAKAIIKAILIDVAFIAGENVFIKSNPRVYRYPFATSCALYLLVKPFGFLLSLKTHLHPIDFLFGGKGTKAQVLFFTSTPFSSIIVVFYFPSWKASTKQESSYIERLVTKTLGLKIIFLDYVTIWWKFKICIGVSSATPTTLISVIALQKNRLLTIKYFVTKSLNFAYKNISQRKVFCVMFVTLDPSLKLSQQNPHFIAQSFS